MKKIILISSTLFVLSCGSYNSIDSFYNSHKNDANVTAIRVPQYILSLIRNSSPEMTSFLANVRDIRFIQISPSTDIQRNQISSQINNLSSNKFVEVFRKNDADIRTLISVRERKDVVKEILISKNGPKNNSVFYLNGSFSPEKVRQYAQSDQLEKLTSNVLQQFNYMPRDSTGIIKN